MNHFHPTYSGVEETSLHCTFCTKNTVPLFGPQACFDTGGHRFLTVGSHPCAAQIRRCGCPREAWSLSVGFVEARSSLDQISETADGQRDRSLVKGVDSSSVGSPSAAAADGTVTVRGTSELPS